MVSYICLKMVRTTTRATCHSEDQTPQSLLHDHAFNTITLCASVSYNITKLRASYLPVASSYYERV